jgi:hypothetical protein
METPPKCQPGSTPAGLLPRGEKHKKKDKTKKYKKYPQIFGETTREPYQEAL